MNCRECQNLTNLYLNDELPLPMFPDYRAHLDECPKCKEDLYINYAINTAIYQLNHEQELSSDFVKEVENRLNATANHIAKNKRKRFFRRFFIVLELIGITALFCLFTPEEKGYAYKPEGKESFIAIEHYGVPSYMDPVLQGIYRYNDEMIQKIREMNALKGDTP